ncbi:MAG TPA: IS200/IS605 family transposase, partial [Desulfobacterales bacterium]|nr:IS200/IS605 family transposase [Desulfobacterales bacterium]
REFGSMGMGKHFWIRGYNVSTVGLDEEQIRRYIREQDKFDRQQMELELR